MPRNANGVYTLPVSSYVSGTAIKSADMNSNLGDIATALTQSLATTGVSTMAGAFKAASGSLATPGIVFSANTGTGWFNDGTANTFSYSANGTLAGKINADGSITWSQAATFNSLTVSAGTTYNGIVTFNGAATFNSTVAFAGIANFPSGLTTTTIVATASTTLNQDIYVNGSSMVFTQCRLTLVSTNLALNAYQGNLLWINNRNYPVPSAGVTLSPSGASASTFYYIYAFMNSGTMTLEYSTTGYTVNTTYGIAQKTGDATRTLVGAALTTAGSAWQDTDLGLGVISYFNRKIKKSKAALASTRSASSGELDSGMRTTFINWSDEIPVVHYGGATQNGTTNYGQSGIAIDSTSTASVLAQAGEIFNNANTTLYNCVAATWYPTGLSENASHYATVVLGGQSTQYFGGAQPGPTCWLTVQIMG